MSREKQEGAARRAGRGKHHLLAHATSTLMETPHYCFRVALPQTQARKLPLLLRC